MLDQDWIQPTIYFSPGDPSGFSSVLDADVRRFSGVSRDEAAGTTVSMARQPISIPGIGSKQNLNARDLAILLDLLPDDRR